MAVIINTDGAIEPATAPIQRIGETYILTGDVGRIAVERSNIVLDGNGYMLPGMISSYDDTIKGNITALNTGGVYLTKVENVTVKNLNIKSSQTGVYLDQTVNCVITNNTITTTYAPIPQLQVTAGIFVWAGNNNVISANKLADNYNGIYVGYNSSKNTIIQNDILTSKATGAIFWDSTNNTVYQNNFINNSQQVSTNSPNVNIWNSALNGNYWSNYNGSDNNGDGIGDTPYKIDENNIDHYPLSNFFNGASATPTVPALTKTQLFLIAALVAIFVVSVGVVAVGLNVHFRRHKKAVQL